MNEAALRAHLNKLGLPASGIEYVIGAALEQPAKSVFHSNARAFSGQMPSEAPTTLTDIPSDYRLQFAALSTEFAFASVERWKKGSLLILDQPTAVPLTITNAAGKTQRIKYTADYLVVRDSIVEVVECKRAEQLEYLCRKHPGQWSVSDTGFTNPPAKSYFEILGLKYRVVTDRELPSLLVQNCLLLQSFASNFSPLPSDVLTSIAAWIRKKGPCSVSDVVNKFELGNAAAVMQGIENGTIHADLEGVRLADDRTRFLCGTRAEAQAIGHALRAIDKCGASREAVPYSEVCDPRHLGELGRRLAYVNGSAHEDGQDPPCGRTIQTWIRKFQKEGISGLMPKWSNCGTRGHRIEQWHIEVIQEAIRKGRSGTKHSTCRSAYEEDYKEALGREAHSRGELVKPISESHFYTLWNERNTDPILAQTRGGIRLANSTAPYTPIDIRLEKASFPFLLAHIDHCFLPVKSKKNVDEEETYTPGENPILTLMIDGFTDEPLAWHLSLEPPSSRATLLCLRKCARRFGRLPAILLTDGGSDFKGNAIAQAMAGLGATWMKRPSSSGRAGQPVERPFNTVNMSACRGFPGYVQNLLNRRGVDRRFDPEHQPKRCFDDLRETLRDLLDHVLPDSPGANGEESPRQMRESFESTYGQQGIRVDPTAKKFLILTSLPVETDSTTTEQGAIRYNERRYVSRELIADPQPASKIFPRIDSEDDSIMYFGLNGHWHSAISSHRLHRSGVAPEVLSETWAVAPGKPRKRNIARAMAKQKAKRKSEKPDSKQAPHPALEDGGKNRPAQNGVVESRIGKVERLDGIESLLHGDAW